jgi:WD40 repeat protein
VTAQILNPVWQRPGIYTGVDYSADGKFISTSVVQDLLILNAGDDAVASVTIDDPFWRGLGLPTFSPDSKWLAAVKFSVDVSSISGEQFSTSTVIIRDAKTLAIQRCQSGNLGNGPASFLAFSPDGSSILSTISNVATEDFGSAITARTFAILDTATGDRRWELTVPVTPPGTVLGPMPAVYSPTSQQIAYATPDKNGLLIVDAMTGAPVFAGPAGVTIATPAAVSTLAYSPDGRWLIAGCLDSSIHVFDPVVGTSPNAKWPITLPGGGTDGITSVAVSADSRWVAAINSNFFGIYSLPDATPRFSPPLPLNLANRQLVYSPNLHHVIATALFPGISGLQPLKADAPLAVIDAFTGAVLATNADPVSEAALSPDGTSIACTTAGSVELLDLRPLLAMGVVLAQYPNAANTVPYPAGTALTGVVVSPADSPPLIAVADTSPAVRVVNAETGLLVAGPRPVQGVINAVTFARQGQAVVTAASTGLHLFVLGGGSADWDLGTIGAVKALTLIAATVGESLAVAVDKTAQLRGTATGAMVWSTNHPQTVTRIAGSTDGRFVATGCQDRITRILDAATGATVFTGPVGNGRVTAVAFAPTSSLMASANEDGTVLLINPANLTQNGQLPRNNFPCRLLAFSGDGTMLGVADDANTVTVYDLTDLTAPKPLPQPPPFTAPITALGFDPAGPRLAVATGETTVAVHDARTGIAVQRLVHPQPARQFAFNVTGTYLATICDDQTTRTWRMAFE